MDSLEDRETLISEEKIGSDTETTDKILDLESGAIDELNQPAPGIWLRPTSSKHCCIYRVPHCIRQVNPEAYTPQSVIIGPLHHSLISQALKSRGDITNTKSMGYLNMERLKKDYLTEFARRLKGEQTIDGLRRIVEENEDMIRKSYSESTAWIESPQFIDMILRDSVFIIEFIVRSYENRVRKPFGEPLMDMSCLYFTVINDLLLLENQLPYFIIEKLSDGIAVPGITFRQLVIKVLLEEGRISDNSEFRHFTDLIRLVIVALLDVFQMEYQVSGIQRVYEKRILHMYTASKLDSGGVQFEALKENFSLDVRFENGCLKMSCLTVDDRVEMRLRNIMALEQCHYPYNTHVCDYVSLLDCLINTYKDVELLAEKGIIKNLIGPDGDVAEMVNKLCLGISNFDLPGYKSYYFDIAGVVNAYYYSWTVRSLALLKRVYFGKILWTGMATIGSIILLVLAFLQTVASINQTKN